MIAITLNCASPEKSANQMQVATRKALTENMRALTKQVDRRLPVMYLLMVLMILIPMMILQTMVVC